MKGGKITIEISADGHCTVDMVVAEQSAQEIVEVHGHFLRLLRKISRETADQIAAATGRDWMFWLGHHEARRAEVEQQSSWLRLTEGEVQ